MTPPLRDFAMFMVNVTAALRHCPEFSLMSVLDLTGIMHVGFSGHGRNGRVTARRTADGGRRVYRLSSVLAGAL